MKKLFNFLLFSCVCLLQSCTPDFDVNAEWEEITVIYGILDANEYYHHVKVNKAFLNTNSDALLIASSMPDSTYHYDSITVELYKLDADGNILETYSLHKIIINNKEEGLFNYPGQIIYQTESVVLDQAKKYKILVRNTKTGKITDAITPIVDNFSITNPNPNLTFPVNFEFDYTIRFDHANEASIYKAYIIINYLEILNGDTTNHSLKWVVEPSLISDYKAGKTIKIIIKSGTFFDFLAASIDSTKDDKNLTRTMEQLEFVVYAGSEDLEKYIRVNNNYSAITQTKPFFTNVNDGAGLFASRYRQSVFGAINQKNIDYIKNNYPGLKFK